MTLHAWVQIGLFLSVLLILAKPLGIYMAHVYQLQPIWGISRLLGPLERGIYRLSGITQTHEQNWRAYALSCLAFNLVGLLSVYLLQRFQSVLPLNPADMGPVTPDSSFNTAVSFATNTN